MKPNGLNELSQHPMTETRRHCVFRCQENRYGLPATSVREITYAPELSSVPDSDASLAGMCHFRSEFIPVIRIDALLGGRSFRKDENEMLLVLNSSTGPWAVLISEVLALEALDTLTGGDTSIDDPVAGVVLGTAMFRDDVVRVLDAHRLQQLAQSQLESHWQLSSHAPNTSCIR